MIAPEIPLTPRLGLFVLVGLVLMAAMFAAWAGAVVRVAMGYPLLVAAKPRRVPWGLVSVSSVVVLYIAISRIVVSGYAHSRPDTAAAVQVVPKASMGSKSPFSAYELLALMSLINIVFVPIVPGLLRITSGARLADMGLTTRGVWPNLARGVFACLLVAPIAYGLMIPLSFYQKPEPHPLASMVQEDPSGWTAALAVVAAVFLAPAAEELFFRGILLGWLSRFFQSRLRRFKPPPENVALDHRLLAQPLSPGHGGHDVFDEFHEDVESSAQNEAAFAAPLGPRPYSSPLAPDSAAERAEVNRDFGIWPNVFTSLIFAALHWAQWPAPIPLFVLSMVLGILYQRTGSLWAPLALHACFNGLSTAMLLLGIWAGVPLTTEQKVVPPPARVPAAVRARAPLQRSMPWDRREKEFRRTSLGKPEDLR